MGLTLVTGLRNSMADQVTAKIDAGSGAGYIEIWTAAFATKLSTHVMSDPSLGASVAGVITANAIADDSSADASGTAATFKIFDSDATEVLRGTIGTSGADINFAGGVAFTAGQIVKITSLTFTQPAS